MLLTDIICVTVLIFSPAFSDAESVLRNKRSDDFVPCEKGWYYFREKCYRIGGRKRSERLSWEKAVTRCRNFGGDLVTIQSQEEQDFIVSILLLDLKYFAWIGLHDRQNESDYKWSDGSVVGYTNWNKMEPTGIKDEKEDCVQMLFEPENDIIGNWNDNSCDIQLPYICQMNKNGKKKSPNRIYCSAEEDGGWRFQNSCYHVVTEMKSWHNAEKHCKDNYNGHLVTVLDTIVDSFLDYMLANIKKEMWIGIKIQEQLQQKWSSRWHVSYNGFDKEGNFIENTCVIRKKRKEWLMVPCSKKYSFICEVSKVTPPVLNLPARGSHCPEELDDWRDLDGERCYYIEVENSHNWYEADFNCKRRGGNLVSLHSKEESDILLPFVRYTHPKIFIGLFRLLAHEEEFSWSDGSTINYINWNNDEPNNEEEKCVEALTYDMKWNDCSCEDKKGYICSVKKVLLNLTTVEDAGRCAGHISLKVLIGVCVCVLLVTILLGIVVYYFRPCTAEHRKNSTAISTTPPSPSKTRLKYRSTTELTLRDDDHYEDMM